MADTLKPSTSGKAASAALFAPEKNLSEKSDILASRYPADAIVRMQRPDGSRYLLRVPGEHLDRLIELAAAEFKGVVK